MSEVVVRLLAAIDEKATAAEAALAEVGDRPWYAAEEVRMDSNGMAYRSIERFSSVNSAGQVGSWVLLRTVGGSEKDDYHRALADFVPMNDPASVLRLCQSHRDIVAMFPVSAPHLDTEGAFYGFQSRDCGEHRTVGPHRAWCFDCSEWCYPAAPCQRCHGVSDVIVTLARGYGIEDGETK